MGSGRVDADAGSLEDSMLRVFADIILVDGVQNKAVIVETEVGRIYVHVGTLGGNVHVTSLINSGTCRPLSFEVLEPR